MNGLMWITMYAHYQGLFIYKHICLDVRKAFLYICIFVSSVVDPVPNFRILRFIDQYRITLEIGLFTVLNSLLKRENLLDFHFYSS